MVALWLRHDNDHDQRLVEGSASGPEKAGVDAWPQFKHGSHRRFGIQRAQPAGGYAGIARASTGDAGDNEIQRQALGHCETHPSRP